MCTPGEATGQVKVYMYTLMTYRHFRNALDRTSSCCEVHCVLHHVADSPPAVRFLCCFPVVGFDLFLVLGSIFLVFSRSHTFLASILSLIDRYSLVRDQRRFERVLRHTISIYRSIVTTYNTDRDANNTTDQIRSRNLNNRR